MTALAQMAEQTAPVPGRGFAVSTVASDDLRAAMRVEGVVTERTCPLLLGIVQTHLRAGRRYLRIDVATTRIDEAPVLTQLLDAHRTLAAAGGMLLFDNASPELAAALTTAGLLAVRAG